jgi:hypothetical protein
MARGWARKNSVVIGGRGPAAGLDALLEVGVVQQAEPGVVEQFVFLAFLQCFDGEPQLVLDLVHRLVEQVRDARVYPQHGLRDAQFVLPRRKLIIDERAGQIRFALVPGGQCDIGFTVLVLREFRARPQPIDVLPQGFRRVEQPPHVVPAQHESRDRRECFGGIFPIFR